MAGNTGVANVDLVFSDGSLQNGADAVALYVGDAVDFPDGTVPTGTDLIDALVYDTDDADDAGLLAALTPGQAQINERGGGNGPFHSNSRVPNGGSALDTSSYVQQDPTPGESNLPPASVVINEVDADTPSTDTMEFVELFGDANGSLDGLVVVFYNGNGDTSYAA